MVIVDSSVWIDFLRASANPQTVWLEKAIGHQQVGLTSLILCEILQGAQTNGRFSDFLHDLKQFPIFDACSIDLSIASARNYRTLRQTGYTVRKTIDCLIATFCIEHGHHLLHNDRDFDAFENHLGLHVLHPPALALN